MVLWDWNEKEEKIEGRKQGSASSEKPVVIRPVPINSNDEEAARA